MIAGILMFVKYPPAYYTGPVDSVGDQGPLLITKIMDGFTKSALGMFTVPMKKLASVELRSIPLILFCSFHIQSLDFVEVTACFFIRNSKIHSLQIEQKELDCLLVSVNIWIVELDKTLSQLTLTFPTKLYLNLFLIYSFSFFSLHNYFYACWLMMCLTLALIMKCWYVIKIDRNSFC